MYNWYEVEEDLNNSFYNVIDDGNKVDEIQHTENSREICSNSIVKEKIGSEFNNLSGSNLEHFSTGYCSNLSRNENSNSNNFSKKKKIYKITKDQKKKKKLGRKKKYWARGKHNKFSPDNMTRKFKRVFFESILNYIRSRMKNVGTYENKYVKPIFFKIEQNYISNINANFNKNMIKRSLKDIFLEKVSKKYSNYGLDHNRKLIEKIYDEKIQTEVIDILDMTFGDCLEHLRGNHYKQLEGFEKEYEIVINELKNKDNDDEYMTKFKAFGLNFVQYSENKRSREK